MYRDIVSAYTGNLLAHSSPHAVGSRKMLRDEAGILAACSIYLWSIYLARRRGVKRTVVTAIIGLRISRK